MRSLFAVFRRRAPLAAALGVAVAAALVYLPALSNDWVNWDDHEEILNNALVHSLSWPSIKEMCTNPVNGNTIPLTWLSHAAVWSLWNDDAGAHHATNLVLHAANCLLAFYFFYTLLGLSRRWHGESGAAPPVRLVDIGVASAAALLWAIHPQHVESVAWVTERKDLLSTFFFLLSILCYLRYASSERRVWWRLWPTFLFFVLSLLSKPMAVTLPVVFLIFDWWPLGRFKPDLFRLRGFRAGLLLEKIPFLLVSVLCGLLAIHSQDSGVMPLSRIPLDYRVMNAFHSIVFYLQKMVWPAGLAPVYPITDPAAAAYCLANLVSLVMVVLFTVAAFSPWGRKRPSIPASWLFYLVTLAPVLGILQVGRQAAADRYTYIPLLSICLLVAGKLTALEANLERKSCLMKKVKPVPLFYAACLVALGCLCVNQIKVWKDSVALWEHQVALYPDEAAVAHANLGGAYMTAGRLDEAIAAYRKSLRILEAERPLADPAAEKAEPRKVLVNKEEGMVHSYLGLALIEKSLEDKGGVEARRLKEEAAVEFQKALTFDPNDLASLYHYGVHLKDARRPQEAEKIFRRGLSLKPDSAEFAAELAAVCFRQRKIPEALAAVRQAIALSQPNPELYLLEGEALEVSGNAADAVRSYQKALAIEGDLPLRLRQVLENNLARARRRLQQ